MNRLLALLGLLALTMAGCTSVHITKSLNDVRVDSGALPAMTLEIENSGWFLLSCIPLASGNPQKPNRVSSCLFSNTVTVKSNIDVLRSIMMREQIRDVANLTSHYQEEKFLFFLFARRAYHTSAVLIQPESRQPTPEEASK